MIGRFDGGKITSDAGALLLREAEWVSGVLRRLAACFTDHRDPDLIGHTVCELVAQRVYGLCLGYEDLYDHDALRHDPLPAVLVGKHDPTGEDRARQRDKGKALAGKSMLIRLELTPVRADADSCYKKITVHRKAVQDFFVDAFLQAHESPPPWIILDLDATDKRPTKKRTVLAGTWRTASRKRNSASSPIAPTPPPCGPTNFACGSPRRPTC